MKIELIGITQFLKGNNTPDELLEFAGRICYRSTQRGDAGDFVMKRVREGHESIIEHLRFIFRITGVPDSELLDAYRVAQGIALTIMGESKVLSLNARTLRDMVRDSDTQLARALLEIATRECPSVFQDLASNCKLSQVAPNS